MNKTLVVSDAQAAKLLSMGDYIEAMDDVLRDASSGSVNTLQRTMMFQKTGNILGIMPSSISSKEIMGLKATVFPNASAQKNKTAQGIVTIFDTVTGSLRAVVGAKKSETMRTAATSACATRALARKDASSLCILGAGKQGRAHLDSVSLVRDIKKVYVWDIVPETVSTYCDEMGKAYPKISFTPCATAKEAVVNADIICTVTKSHTAVLQGEWVKPGAHINAVGACAPVFREVDTCAVQKSRVFVDKKEMALQDAGDLLLPIRAGEWSADKIIGEVGEVLLGKKEGRRTEEEITMFESVGLAAEDLAGAYLIYNKAKEQGIGLEIEI